MKNKRKQLILLISSIIITFITYYNLKVYLKKNETDWENLGIALFIIILGVLTISIINHLLNTQERKRIQYQEKLFRSLLQNSNTFYLMYDIKKEAAGYYTQNLLSVLGIKQSDKHPLTIINEIFNTPIIKEEIRSWDKKSEFVSQMVSYTTKDSETKTWIKIKIYPYFTKKQNYYIILIASAVKEHDQQHQLVTQAGDIKRREQQLNQITTSSYDIEMNIKIDTQELIMRNLKEHINYLGPNQNGNYQNILINIIEKYIDKEDQKKVKKILLNGDTIKQQLLSGIELEPITIKYKLAEKINKQTVWLESTVFFTKSRSNIYATILTKDVTENAEYMRKQNVMLKNALKEAKNANAAKSEFMAILSHEIRTPMNTIIGLSETILTEELPANIKEDIENINSASTNLLDVIDGILDISKIESGIIEKNEKEYETPKLFKDLESITKERIGKKKINLELDIDSTIPITLYGDIGKIRQILQNLLDNAVKFTENGTITIKADCEKKKTNVQLKISIKDTGIGIEHKKLELILTDKKTENNYENGMGLYISKKLIDAMNGEISCESKLGEGSTFTITLNQKIINDKEMGNIDLYKYQTKITNGFDTKGKSILIVDDNKLNQKVALKLLKSYGSNLTTVDSGKECIELITKGQKFDLILLDQMMPELNGTQTLHELKKIKDFNTPVIMLTADALVGKKEEYLKEGFDDYLSKPIDAIKLKEILKKYLKTE